MTGNELRKLEPLYLRWILREVFKLCEDSRSANRIIATAQAARVIHKHLRELEREAKKVKA